MPLTDKPMSNIMTAIRILLRAISNRISGWRYPTTKPIGQGRTFAKHGMYVNHSIFNILQYAEELKMARESKNPLVLVATVVGGQLYVTVFRLVSGMPDEHHKRAFQYLPGVNGQFHYQLVNDKLTRAVTPDSDLNSVYDVREPVAVIKVATPRQWLEFLEDHAD